MSRKIELRLAGSGGQGLVLAGIILAEAAVLYDGKRAVQTQSYGPEARGGASKSEVIISQEDIDYPKCENLDVLLALTQESCNKYVDDLKATGTLLLDTDQVGGIPKGPWEKVICIPFLAIARDQLGKQMVANIVALGALVALTGVVTREAIEQAVLNRVPKGTEDLNKRALEAGFEAARKAA
ncbi:MAG: 2-oxoacid:acceptor oxidoreductase family protein [Candidatus Alcyoniella australis]|nr:2-oxoacid:acceptor oxidoreductase family protein [Candidatus Alcyoniella australis]